MPADSLAVLDAVPVEQVPAAILRLTARLVAAPRPEAPDDLLTVEDAAALLRQTFAVARLGRIVTLLEQIVRIKAPPA